VRYSVSRTSSSSDRVSSSRTNPAQRVCRRRLRPRPYIRHTMGPMNWNDAAEDFLNLVVAQTPRPVRENTEAELRALAESMAEEDGKNRVGVETVIAAWVRSTPESLRADLPRQMERYGLDPAEYRSLLE
jgi:hypothetical protein